MKRVFTLPKFKRWHKRRINHFKIRARKNEIEKRRRLRNKKNRKAKKTVRFIDIKASIYPHPDLRLLVNTENCLIFFRALRDESNISRNGHKKVVLISMKYVTQIDYAALSVLSAIFDDLKFKGIGVQGDFPSNSVCLEFIKESGFLNHMYDGKGKPYPKTANSEMIFFEKGCGALSEEDNKKISLLIKNVIKHLTGNEEHCLPLRTIILEICGNSIEWGNSLGRQWLLGVKYESNKNVVFTVTDVGRGILETLYRKFSITLSDIFTFKSNDDILQQAFDKKYGSSTKEENRNKGLPAVKVNFNIGNIKALKVLTNDVILHFDDNKKSRTFKKGAARFKGTFYQWEFDMDCLSKINLANSGIY